MAQKQDYKVFNELDEIFKNKTEQKLWLLIHNKVYDCTNFKHPGGKKILLKYAGKDATKAFDDQAHKDADKYLKDLCIGELEYDEGLQKKLDAYP